MGILEDLLDRLDSIDGKIEELIEAKSGGGTVSDLKPAKKAAAKKAAAKKAAAKKDSVATPEFLGAIKDLSAEHRAQIEAARDELFDPEMKVRDIPVEERQNFLDRIAALVEEKEDL